MGGDEFSGLPPGYPGELKQIGKKHMTKRAKSEAKQAAVERPSSDSTFSLVEGVALEPFADGSAVLYSEGEHKSVSLNHTGALLCSYADGSHTLSHVLQEMRQLFPNDVLDEEPLINCLAELEAEGFVLWE